MDELANFAGAPAGLIEAEARLLERADVVFTGGRSLYESKRDRNPNVHCFPSAVEPEHFARALDPDLPLPADLAGLPRPIFGYYGAVDERLDYDLIAALADATGVGSVVLVGPTIKVDPAALPRRPNLHYLGQKSYDELPAYLKGVRRLPDALGAERGDPDDQPDEDPRIHGRRQADRLDGRARRGPRPRRPRLRGRRRPPSSSSWR